MYGTPCGDSVHLVLARQGPEDRHLLCRLQCYGMEGRIKQTLRSDPKGNPSNAVMESSLCSRCNLTVSNCPQRPIPQNADPRLSRGASLVRSRRTWDREGPFTTHESKAFVPLTGRACMTACVLLRLEMHGGTQLN